MSELLPERLTEPPEGETKKDDKRKATKWPIQSIATWSLGFSVYMGVMAVKHSERVPDLAAYMAQIIQTSRQFKGIPWQDYDTRFRMQVAAAKRPHLVVVDPPCGQSCLQKQSQERSVGTVIAWTMSQETAYRSPQQSQKGRNQQPSDTRRQTVKSQSWTASTTRPVAAGEEPNADFVTCVSGVEQTTLDIDALPEEQDVLFP